MLEDETGSSTDESTGSTYTFEDEERASSILVELIQSFGDFFLSLCWGHAEDAEVLAQELYVRLRPKPVWILTCKKGLEDATNLFTVVARRAAADQGRRSHRLQHREELHGHQLAHDSPVHTPLEILIAEEEADRKLQEASLKLAKIEVGLAHLSAQEQQLFEWAKKMTSEQIGERLNIKPNTVRKRLQRIRERLAQAGGPELNALLKAQREV